MIDQFSKDRFEQALFNISPSYNSLGLQQGEETYSIEINSNAHIIIRSSIDNTGIAGDTGQNSIRLWLEIWQESNNRWQPQKKLDAYTIRVNGWEGRLKDKISILWQKGIERTKTQQPQKGSKVELIPLENISLDELAEQSVSIDLADFLAKEQEQEKTKPKSIIKEPNSQQQKAITANIQSNIRVLAPPGSGKSFTNENRYKHLANNGIDPANILAATFSKKMADEMGNRIIAICPEAKLDQISTIHAFCFRVLCRWYQASPYFGWSGLERKKKEGKLTEWQYINLVKDTISKVWQDDEKPGYKEVLNLIATAKHNNNFSQRFFVNRVDQFYGLWLFKIAQVLGETLQKHEQLTFADMLWFMEQELNRNSEFLKWCQVRFPHVMIDEGQDTNSQAMRILLKIASHSFISADVDQCLIEGQNVLTPNGYIPVEQIKKYDKVISALGGGKYGYRFVTNVQKQAQDTTIVTIKTKTGCELKVTYNHIVFASIIGRSTHTKYLAPDLYYVYIMYKRGYGFRIGTTKNPLTRLNGEHADALWLIRSYENYTQALYDESLLSFQYGIPTTVFNDHKGKHSPNRLTQSWIDRLFSEVDTHEAINRFSKSEKFIFDMPHVVPQNYGARVSVRFEMCREAPSLKKRSKSATHVLLLETSHQESIDKITEAGFSLKDTKKDGKQLRLYSKDAKSLEIKAKHLSEILNGSLIIKGCFIPNRTYSLAPQAMPAGNVLPGFCVPILKDNEIVLDKVVSVTKELYHGATYDIEVMDTANFIAEGLVVHNCLFRFQGAYPELITNDYTNDIETIMLDKNYRSTEEIIKASQLLISYNYSDNNGPYDQKFMKDVSGVKAEGDPINFQMYNDIETEGQGVSETILEQCQNGYEFGSFFVGARTRAQLGYLEGSLFRAKIKFINISCNGSFWQSKHAADVIGYLRLANDMSDKEALKRVYNIASNDHEYLWNDRSGKFDKGDYCPTRYLGNAFLEKIDGEFGKIDDFLLNAEDGWRFGSKGDKAQNLLDFVYDLQGTIDQIENVGQIIQVILDDCYTKWLKHTEGIVANDESENGKLEDLNTVVDIASSFENVDKFLEYVDEMILEAEDAKQGNWDDYVILSTYHGLKGLERPIVCGTGWCEGYQLDTLEPRGLLPHTFSLIPPPQFGVLPSGNQSPIEDERCIGFVCISRAQEKVFLSGCQSYRDWILEPSRFIKELELLEEKVE